MPDLSNALEVLQRQDASGNSLLRWLLVVLATLAIVLALRLFKAALGRRIGARGGQAAENWFHAAERLIRRTRSWFLFIVAIYCAGNFVVLPDNVSRIVNSVTVVALSIQAALWADAFLSFAISRYVEQHKDVDAAGATTLAALGFLGRLAVWVVALLSAVASLGVNITALVAGFGIGGVAVALAAQNILGDLFASVSIVLDKPFVLGDFIVIDDKMGSVEYIGLKTTRLRSLSGEQLVFANADLLKSRIHNYKRMCERRVLFTLGVAYETPYDKVAALPAVLREIIEAQQPVRFDRAHFARYGDSALIFEVVYYVTAADYNVYMNVQQAVNLAILRRFADERIEFAYPTRTVHLCQ